MTGTPWYHLMANPSYGIEFNYFGPNVPEREKLIEDGFADEDGCPEIDNDLDGLEDSVDQCPDLAEDLDEFEDGDGCPDPDGRHRIRS